MEEKSKQKQDTPQKPPIDLAAGKKTALKGMISLALLATVKALGGFLTGTVVLLADAVNTLSDILSLFASYIGLSWSQKRSRKDFRYGYYKVESLAALIVAVLTLFLAYQIFLKSLNRLFIFQEVQYPQVGAGIVLFSIIMAVRLSYKLEKTGLAINSPSLKNNAQDRKLGILASVAVLFGIFASYYRIPYVEGLIGMAMAILIFKIGFSSARDSFFFLLDYWDDPKMIENIRKVIKKYSNIVQEVKNIRLRRAGPVIFGEIFLEINPFANIKTLKGDLDKLNQEIKNLNPYFKDLVIFTFIPKPNKIRIGIPIKRNKKLNSKIARRFSSIKHYVFVDIVDNKIKDFQIFKFKFRKNQYDKIGNFLEKHKPNVLIAPDIHSLIYCQLLVKSNVDIYPPFRNLKTVKDIIKLLIIDIDFGSEK